MKLTSLGCWGGYPKASSANSSFLLEEDGFRLLIDCGSGVLAQLQRAIPLEKLDALILSHYHHDHIADVGCLQYAMLIQRQRGERKQPFPIYAHSEGENLFHTLSYKQHTEARRIGAEHSIQLGPWRVEFHPANHTAYCLAMKFIGKKRVIVYTGDTAWSDDLARFAAGADTLICECSLFDEQQGQVPGHMTAGEAGRMAKAADAQHLILTHFPHYGDRRQLLREAKNTYSGWIEMAEEQKTWEW